MSPNELASGCVILVPWTQLYSFDGPTVEESARNGTTKEVAMGRRGTFKRVAPFIVGLTAVGLTMAPTECSTH